MKPLSVFRSTSKNYSFTKNQKNKNKYAKKRRALIGLISLDELSYSTRTQLNVTTYKLYFSMFGFVLLKYYNH